MFELKMLDENFQSINTPSCASTPDNASALPSDSTSFLLFTKVVAIKTWIGTGVGHFKGGSIRIVYRINDEHKMDVHVIKSIPRLGIATVRLRVNRGEWILRTLNEWGTCIEFKEMNVDSKLKSYLEDRNSPFSRQIDFEFEIFWCGWVDDYKPTPSSTILTIYNKDMQFSDMKVKIDYRTLDAHRYILSSYQSEKLQKMVQDCDTKNCCGQKDNCINLSGVLNRDDTKELLTFIYESKFKDDDKDNQFYIRMLKVGNDLELEQLKKYCGLILSNKLDANNVLDFLDAAMKYDSYILRRRAVMYIVLNRGFLRKPGVERRLKYDMRINVEDLAAQTRQLNW